MRHCWTPSRSLDGFILVCTLVLATLLGSCAKGERQQVQGDAWELDGPLLAWDGPAWIIDAVPVIVPAGLDVEGQRHLGATVDASGTYDDSGQRVAKQVRVAAGRIPDSTLPSATVSGPIVRIADELWTVDDTDVLVPDGTSVEMVDPDKDASPFVRPGSLATIEDYELADDRVLAVTVSIREPHPDIEPRPAAPADSDEDAPPVDGVDGTTTDDGTSDDGARDDAGDDAANDAAGEPDNHDSAGDGDAAGDDASDDAGNDAASDPAGEPGNDDGAADDGAADDDAPVDGTDNSDGDNTDTSSPETPDEGDDNDDGDDTDDSDDGDDDDSDDDKDKKDKPEKPDKPDEPDEDKPENPSHDNEDDEDKDNGKKKKGSAPPGREVVA